MQNADLSPLSSGTRTSLVQYVYVYRLYTYCTYIFSRPLFGARFHVATSRSVIMCSTRIQVINLSFKKYKHYSSSSFTIISSMFPRYCFFILLQHKQSFWSDSHCEVFEGGSIFSTRPWKARARSGPWTRSARR
jgi:hypothetical protein